MKNIQIHNLTSVLEASKISAGCGDLLTISQACGDYGHWERTPSGIYVYHMS